MEKRKSEEWGEGRMTQHNNRDEKKTNPLKQSFPFFLPPPPPTSPTPFYLLRTWLISITLSSVFPLVSPL